MSRDTELWDLLKRGETLTVEFKSDVKSLPDRELIGAIVALANTEGGELFLGVEDDGTVTGLHPNHENISSLAVFIANRTIPSLAVRVELLESDERKLVRVSVILVPDCAHYARAMKRAIITPTNAAPMTITRSGGGTATHLRS